LQRGVSEDRIPFRDLAVLAPRQRDGLGSIKHAEQRTPAPAGQVFGQGSHQTLHRFVLDQTDAHVARVLQTRGEEMDALTGTIQKLHVHLPKIVLTESLPGVLQNEPAAWPTSDEGRRPARTTPSCLPDSRFPAPVVGSSAKAGRTSPVESPPLVSGSSPPCCADQSVVELAPRPHRHAAPVLLPRCALRTATK